MSPIELSWTAKNCCIYCMYVWKVFSICQGKKTNTCQRALLCQQFLDRVNIIITVTIIKIKIIRECGQEINIAKQYQKLILVGKIFTVRHLPNFHKKSSSRYLGFLCQKRVGWAEGTKRSYNRPDCLQKRDWKIIQKNWDWSALEKLRSTALIHMLL